MATEYYLEETMRGTKGQLGRSVGSISVTGTADVQTRFGTVLAYGVTVECASNVFEIAKGEANSAGQISIHVVAIAGAGTPSTSAAARTCYFWAVGKEAAA